MNGTTLTILPETPGQLAYRRKRMNVWHAAGPRGKSACGEHSGMVRPGREFLAPGKLFSGCFRCVACFYLVHCGVRDVRRT